MQRTAAKSSDKEKRYAAAYQLATMLYQACCYGDCWCLTHYGNSSADTPEPREKDFVEMARQYLEQSVKSQDADMQWKSQYALAFLPTDEYKSSEWDETTSKYVTLIHKNSLSYRYLNRLNEMRREMPFTPAYVTKCVVLKDFVKDVN